MQIVVTCRDEYGEVEYEHEGIIEMMIRGGCLFLDGQDGSGVHIVYAEGAWHHYVTQAEAGAKH